MKFLLLITIAFAFTLNVQAQTKTVHGFVFLDNNNNSIFDETEEPLPNISVSNLSTITKTNTIGQFQLENEVRDIVID
ncbi:MAG: hypothetical protein PF541_13355 [Prolixibacteraceae bacterium]|jgi:hypothetical protein|nr:hypothetical protein [Prolixibacteraceae bacterium]